MGSSIHKHNFADIEELNFPRTRFKRNFSHKTTFDFDKIIPIHVDEILPGDTLEMKVHGFARLATLAKPLMHEMRLSTYAFFVPTRLVWENWKRFLGERDPDPDSSIDYSIPVTTINNAAELSLWDYFGIPTKIAQDKEVNALIHRAYRSIYKHFFRDQDLIDSPTISTGDGPDTAADVDDIFTKAKGRDYFTVARPDPQKGDAVDIPLGTSAPLTGTLDVVTDGTAPTFKLNAAGSHNLQRLTGTDVDWTGSPATGTATWDDPHLEGDLTAHTADLTNATAATINDIRLAIYTQMILELDQSGGTRYPEILYTHWGVISDDASLQLPQYLGGGTNSVNVNAIAQQSETSTTNLGHLGGIGTIPIDGDNNAIVASFSEHGYLIVLACAYADVVYQQGLHRMWTRETRYDFYEPLFANLGEQGIRNDEIYMQGTAADETIFGYIPAWSEYRYNQNILTGLFRSNCTASLEAQHLSQEFGSLPTLNQTFVESTTPMDRALLTSTEPHVILDAYFEKYHTRTMPVHSTPGKLRI